MSRPEQETYQLTRRQIRFLIVLGLGALVIMCVVSALSGWLASNRASDQLRQAEHQARQGFINQQISTDKKTCQLLVDGRKSSRRNAYNRNEDNQANGLNWLEAAAARERSPRPEDKATSARYRAQANRLLDPRRATPILPLLDCSYVGEVIVESSSSGIYPYSDEEKRQVASQNSAKEQ